MNNSLGSSKKKRHVVEILLNDSLVMLGNRHSEGNMQCFWGHFGNMN